MRAFTYTAVTALISSLAKAAPAPGAKSVTSRDHAVAARDSDDDFLEGNNNVAVFWGQSTQDLSDVCANDNFDIVILAFVTSLIPPKLNLGKDTGSASTAQAAKDGWGLFDATVAGASENSVAEQIQDCQGAGKKVMISFGGTESVSNATFSSSDDAEQAADYLWQVLIIYLRETRVQ